MSRTKYSYKLKYEAICEVLKGKTITQVVDEFILPCGGSLLRHWVKRYQHPEELLTNKDFDNEEQYQKILEAKENFSINEIQQLKIKAKEDINVLKKQIKDQIVAVRTKSNQVNLLKKQLKKLTKVNQDLDLNFQRAQNELGELKFKLYQCENLKTDNLELKRENKKLSNLIVKLTKENQDYRNQKAIEKIKKTVIKDTRNQILGSGTYHE